MLIGIIVLIILFLLDVYFIYISFYLEKKEKILDKKNIVTQLKK